MKHFNIEIKARCHRPEWVHNKLLELGADYKGIDQQTDTYFNVPSGKLKLRQGPIENSLIFYRRPEDNQPKRSEVYLERLSRENELEQVLKAALGTLCKVEKKRHIFFIGKVKFHIDELKDIGSFVEIEAIGNPDTDTEPEIRELCNTYMQLLQIQEADLLTDGYFEMLMSAAYKKN